MEESNEQKKDIRERKHTLRSAVRKAERELAAEHKEAADAAIIANVLALPEYHTARTVFAFVGMKREIQTTELLKAILQSGRRLCVPRCLDEPGKMILKEIQSLEELVPGAYGILEPMEDLPTVAAENVDFAVLPCVSCNHSGERLGQGGGYYDRFLENYSGPAAMICREALIQENIPVEPHDIRIPLVVTDGGIFRTMED